MSFLAPLFLLGALAAALPIALHLLRRHSDVVIDFSAVRLLTRAPVSRVRRRRLRELILLALRVLALVLLAVSFARPYVAASAPGTATPLTVVALDTSLSLSAPGQMARARAAARDAVARAPAGHAVAVVTFDTAATLLVGPTADRAGAMAAIATVEAGPRGTRYRTALERVTEVIGERAARVVLVTDLQQAGWQGHDEGGLPDGVAVEVVRLALPPANLSIAGASRRGDVVEAVIENHGDEAARVSARLALSGTELGRAQVEIGPRASVEVALAGALPAAGGAEVAIDDERGYAGDNRRYLLLDPPPPLMVTVVAGGETATSGFYVERALAVAGRPPEFAVDRIDGRRLSSWSAETLADRAAVIVAGTRTLDRRGRELVRGYLSGGGRVWLTLGPDVDPGTLDAVTGVDLRVDRGAPRAGREATLVVGDLRHPVFRPFLDQAAPLGDVTVERYRRLPDRPDAHVLARFAGGDVALAEMSVGQGRLLVFASDVDNAWSRFPLQAAFVPFVVETSRYLTRHRRQSWSWVLPDLPPGLAAAPGIVERAEGTARRLGVINIDPRESSLAAMSAPEFVAAIDRVPRAKAVDAAAGPRAAEARQQWWQVGLALMLAALGAEGLVGRRVT